MPPMTSLPSGAFETTRKIRRSKNEVFDRKILQVMEITCVDEERARTVLSTCDWTVEKATTSILS